jgi:hypothetical protein
LRFKIEQISQNQAIISLEALKTLIDAAKKVDEIEIDEVINDIPIDGLMMLAETSGAFDFLKDEKEDIYTVDDLKVRYQ